MKRNCLYLVLLLLISSLTACSSGKVMKFVSLTGDRTCLVEVDRGRAEGSCATKTGAAVPFALWSTRDINYAMVLEGKRSNDQIATTTRGLIINGVEQGPSDEHWKQLHADPVALCTRACGNKEWREE